MAKVVFKRLYQHGDKTFRPHVEYDEKDVPEILKGFAVKVESKKKSKGKVEK